MVTRFETALGVGAFPDEFDEIYGAACREYVRDGAFLLDETYLRRLSFSAFSAR